MPASKRNTKLKVDPFDSLSQTEIYEALRNEMDFLHGHPSEARVPLLGLPAEVIGLGFGAIYRARRIEELVHALEESREAPFEQVTRANGRVILKASNAGKAFSALVGVPLPHDSMHAYSEEVELVHRVFHDLGIDTERLKGQEFRDPITGRFVWEVLNDAAARIRAALREQGFVARRRRRKEQARRNFVSAMRYVSNLFKRYSRLLVLRVDLGYRDWANPHRKFTARTPDELRNDLARLFNNRRSNGLFDEMVGYIVKIEEGTTKGPHAHTVLFFDGSRVKSDFKLAERLGEYWMTTITKSEGLFYNCNRHKSRYRRLGIGRIEHDDYAKRENLLLAIAYLTKAEQYLRVRDGGRTFFKGVVKPRTSAAGRPRRERQHDEPLEASDFVRMAPRHCEALPNIDSTLLAGFPLPQPDFATKVALGVQNSKELQ